MCLSGKLTYSLEYEEQARNTEKTKEMPNLPRVCHMQESGGQTLPGANDSQSLGDRKGSEM